MSPPGARTFSPAFLHTRTPPPSLCMTSACVAFLPEAYVLHGCVTDVEETDKLQTLLATCCSD